MTGGELNAALAAVLLALGVAAPVPSFAGGLLLALGAAYAVRSFRGTETQKGIVLSLFAGAFFATVAAACHDATKGFWLWGDLSAQVQMALAGGLSQSIAEGFVAFGGGLKDWLSKLPGGVLPGGKNR